MTYTRHGHHIPGTTTEDEEGKFPVKAQCEGPKGGCTSCYDDGAKAFNRTPNFK